MTKKLLFVAVLSLATLFAKAQVTCGTTYAVNRALQINPAGIAQMQQLEEFTQSYTPTGSRAVKVIPVVVHIIHNYGPENIGKDQVLDAIRILNEDFQQLNSDTSQVLSTFKSRIGAPDFEFRLAQKDPNGNCTDGVTRTVSDLTFAADDNVKDLISWPTNKYFNIWVVESISFGAGGYAYYPGAAPTAAYEGVVVLNTQFGSIGRSTGSNFASRTLTHEAGHYFNLRHTWGNSNDCGSGGCDSDNVTDTPTTEGTCLTCDLGQATCGTLANVQNFMDYATCAIMFTAGQATRMLAASNSSNGGRNNLSTNNNLIATGTNDGYVATCVPVADFLYEPGVTCIGKNVEFTDISYNASVDNSWTWQWSLPGSSSPTSSDQNPVVTYLAAGVYNVSLTVTNVAGGNSITRNQIITVKPSQGLLNTPFAEGIEDGQFPVNPANALYNWEVQSPVATSWVRTTTAAATGSASIKIACNTLAADSKHSLTSPVIDVSNATQSPLTMTYKLAYRYDGTNDDILKVLVSKDCGETWITRQTKSGQNLGTVGNGTSPFTPAGPTDWRTETVNINNIAGEEGILIRFELTAAGQGENLYIDDINIAKSNTVGINEQTGAGLMLSVYPNPITSQSQIGISGTQNGKAIITMFDITGRQLASQTVATQANEANIIQLTNITGGAILPAGVYNIRFQQGNTVVNKRLVVSQ